MNFSDRLKELRYFKDNISQTELASIIGVSKSAVSAYESQCKNSPTLDILIKLAYYFDVSVDYLSGVSDNKFSINGNFIQLPLDVTLEQYDLIKQVADAITKSKIVLIEKDYREFPVKLKNLKSKTGTSQKKIASILSVCPSAISAYESGKHLPNLEALILISKNFNISIDYLIGLSDNPNLTHDKTNKPYILSLPEGTTREQKKLIQRFAIDLIEKQNLQKVN